MSELTDKVEQHMICLRAAVAALANDAGEGGGAAWSELHRLVDAAATRLENIVGRVTRDMASPAGPKVQKITAEQAIAANAQVEGAAAVTPPDPVAKAVQAIEGDPDLRPAS